MQSVNRQSGLSMVEATVILGALTLLTSALAPSIVDYVNDARVVKVKEDCEAIGTALTRLVVDVGPCLKVAANITSTPCPGNVQAELLYSEGNPVTHDRLSGDATIPSDGPYLHIKNWDNDTSSHASSMESQLTTNEVHYPVMPPFGSTISQPAFGLGWRGAYLSGAIGPDPWGSRYLVNAAFLTTPTESSAQPARDGEYEGNHFWHSDVFCISPGPNRLYETAFGDNLTGGGGTRRGGDDFVYVIRGG